MTLLTLYAPFVLLPVQLGTYRPVKFSSDADALWLSTCVRWLRDDSEPPWLAMYGDSLSRGIFFDTITLLNRSGDSDGETRPTHRTNFSVDCTVIEARPPSRRRKCGGYVYDWRQPLGVVHNTRGCERRASLPHLRTGRDHGVRLAAGAAACSSGSGDDNASVPTVGSHAWLSFRLKTFVWEPEYDEPWLQSMRAAPRLPDALLLSFGIWDMQYPPDRNAAKGPDITRAR